MGIFHTVAYGGLDSHKSFGILSCRDSAGKPVVRLRLDYHDRGKLRQQLAQLPKGIPVVVEGTFGWGWICDELAAAGLVPHLASSRKVAAWREARGVAKSNRIDGDLLSELPMQASTQTPWWEVWLAPQEVRDQRELLRYRMSLVRMQTQTKNRIHATLHRHGIVHGFSDLFGVGGRKFLGALIAEQDITLRDSARRTLQGYLRLLDQLRGQIAAINQVLRKILRRHPDGERLKTLPGIGMILAYTILAEVGPFDRFKNSACLCSYSTLVPRAYDSGDEDGSAPIGRHIGHAGRRTLKWAWIEASHGAIRKDAWLRELFDRRTNRGRRDKNRGYILVSRQLCRIAFSCMKGRRDYAKAEDYAKTHNKTQTQPDEGNKPGRLHNDAIVA